MRTTVTLDPDVRRGIEDAMRERGISFKEALNEAVRVGLSKKGARPRKRFVQKTSPLGFPQHFNWDKALAVADAMEDEEIIRKMSLRK